LPRRKKPKVVRLLAKKNYSSKVEFFEKSSMAFSNCSASLRVPYQLNGYSTSVTFFNQKLLNIKFTNEHESHHGYKNRPKIAFVTKKVTFLKYV